jgi:hypothetical protein
VSRKHGGLSDPANLALDLDEMQFTERQRRQVRRPRNGRSCASVSPPPLPLAASLRIARPSNRATDPYRSRNRAPASAQCGRATGGASNPTGSESIVAHPEVNSDSVLPSRSAGFGLRVAALIARLSVSLPAGWGLPGTSPPAPRTCDVEKGPVTDWASAYA